MADDRRSGKFVWFDYWSDVELAACSLAAQGLWMRMLCLMGMSSRPGYLEKDGKLIDGAKLAKLVGITENELSALVDELVANHVCSLQGKHIINRRMVRQAAMSKKNSLNGKKGGAVSRDNKRGIHAAPGEAPVTPPGRLDGRHPKDRDKSITKLSPPQNIYVSEAPPEANNISDDTASLNHSNNSENQTALGRGDGRPIERTISTSVSKKETLAEESHSPSPAREPGIPKSSAQEGFSGLTRSELIGKHAGRDVAIVEGFDGAVVEIFGAEARRNFPAATDLDHARRWLDAGATVEQCLRIFAERLRRAKDSNRQPPSALKYFDAAIAEAVQIATTPLPPAPVPETAYPQNLAALDQMPPTSRFDPAFEDQRRLQTWIDEDLWFAHWGKPPDGPRGIDAVNMQDEAMRERFRPIVDRLISEGRNQAKREARWRAEKAAKAAQPTRAAGQG